MTLGLAKIHEKPESVQNTLESSPHALKWKKRKKKKKILKPVKFSTLLEPLILFLFHLKPCEMISIGAKGTGNSRHRLEP